MIGGLIALAGRLEGRSGVLGIVKLSNVALAMLWGFVVTFVFVRLLPIGEFRSFLVLTAFANFTVSAELGLSAITYARLRRTRVGDEQTFHASEIVGLLWLMGGIVLSGAGLIALAMVTGFLKTAYPALFLAFYGVAAMNLLTLLARRALAAVDQNLWWEALDGIRRFSGIALLIAALGPMPILVSVLLQLVIALAVLWAGLATIHTMLRMHGAQWIQAGRGLAHIRTHYLPDLGRTGTLTLCDVAAYNAPYFTIAAATADPRPLLLFDFVFKLSRALSSVIRALAETVLPGLTRAAFQANAALVRRDVLRCLGLALGGTFAGSVALLLLGPWLANIVFDGNIDIQPLEIEMIIALLFGLSLICVSVYLQWGLGRFGSLVKPSLLLLIGSLLSVPLAILLHRAFGWDLSLTFLGLYAIVHLSLAAIHGAMLLRLSGLAASGMPVARGKKA